MYKRGELSSRLRALLLVGLLIISPAASGITPERGTTLLGWLQQLITSIFNVPWATENEEECNCGGVNPDCGSLHIPTG